MKLVALIVTMFAIAVVAGCGDDSSTAGSPATGGSVSDASGETIETQTPAQAKKRPEPKKVEVPPSPPKELVVNDLIAGTGKTVKKGDYLEVRYVTVRVNGKPFENHWEFPFYFNLTPKEVNPGWVKGLPGMRVGGRRELVVPAALTSLDGAPPADADPRDSLVYVIDLLSIE